MNSPLRKMSEQLWSGEKTTHVDNPMMQILGLEEIEEGLAFISSFANITALSTTEGLVLIDTGSFILAQVNHTQLRQWTQQPLHTAVFTHGHADHVFGVAPFEEEARERGWQLPTVIAHEAVAARFDRYRMTAGYNGVINERQFRIPGLRWPTEYRYPDTTYRDHLHLEIGGESLHLYHGKGETDDATWVWMPERGVLCAGDMFIWASPNCGNPQKVQRYPREWAQALRKMASLQPEILLPGHGPPIWGRNRVEQALTETAALLEDLVEQTLALMNQGARLQDIIHGIKSPAHLLDRPYLRPIYDEPHFVVRNLWRLYGGWWDGNPAHLKPAPEDALAREIADLAGGIEPLVARARALSLAGDHALACHFAEWALQADPASREAGQLHQEIFTARAEVEQSLMAQSVFLSAAKPTKKDSQ